MKNVLKSLAKRVLILLGLTTKKTWADPGIHIKTSESRMGPSDLAQQTILTNTNKEIKDIMKIIKYLEDYSLVIKTCIIFRYYIYIYYIYE